jgi:hypothetical protein
MSTSENKTFGVQNNFGQAITRLWVNHTTSAGNAITQAWMTTDLPAGGLFQVNPPLQVVSSTSDYFTIFWTDQNNNLYGTPYQYKTEVELKGGAVQAVISDITATVDFIQSGEGTLDSVGYIVYELAPRDDAASIMDTPPARLNARQA